MKASELITILQQHPDYDVILSQDSEGNGFGPLTEAQVSGYEAKNREVGLLELTPELKRQGYTEEDVRGKPAIILWP